MNRNDFMKLLAGMGPTDRQTTSEVSELIGVFPYFQSAYLLFLKGLRNTADVRFESQLRKAALHIADREILYYFLAGNEGRSAAASVELKPVADTVHPVKDQSLIQSGQEADLQQTVIESARNSDDLITAIEKNSLAGSGTANGQAGGAHGHSITVAETGANDYSATILLIDEASGEIEERVTYMDPGFSLSSDVDLLELEQDPEPENTDNGAMLQQEKLPGKPLERQQFQAELIDKFIASNPRIEPVRVRDDAPVYDIARQYTENSGGFVTETLAKIYITQGYYSRAIDIYERLSLKYPEKSSYFAAQIEKVKEHLNR